MALTEDECQDLIDACAQNKRFVSVGFNRRFAPYYVELKNRLKKRSSPAVLQCRINSPGISGSYWMADPAIGGAILGEACHFVDLMYWLLESEPLSVSAYTLPTGKQSPIGENNMVATFRFADGSIANLTYCTVGSRSSGGERVEVYTQGLGLVTSDFKRYAVMGKVRENQKRLFAEKGYEEQIKNMIEHVKRGEAPSVSVFDGARATVGCLRMLESARYLEPRSMDWSKLANERS